MRLHALTSLRFFAAFGVLLVHYQGLFSVLIPDLLARAISQLFVMVSFFFVLSGFILGITYRQTDLSNASERGIFFVKRFARIYPIYFLSLLPLAPITIYNAYRVHDQTHLTTAWMVLSKLLMVDYWTPTGIQLGEGWNGPSWSLSVEAAFYLVFPLALVFFRKISTRSLMLWAAVMIVLSIVPASLYDAWRGNSEDGPTRDQELWLLYLTQMPYARLPEFLIGLIAALRFEEIRKWLTRSRQGRLDLVFGAIIVFALFQNLGLAALVNQGMLTVPFLYFVLRFACLENEGFWVHPTLLLLGNSSYALYLLHLPLAVSFELIFKWTGLTQTIYGSPGARLSWGLFQTALAILVSVFAYLWIEVPARRKIIARFAGSESSPMAASQ